MNGQPYPTGTILARRTPEGDDYDRVRVGGHVAAIDNPLKAEWATQTGEGVVVAPADGFGAPKDVPSTVIAEEYIIESEPPEAPVQERKPERLRTAEQQFADEGREATKSAAAASSAQPEDAVASPPVVAGEEEGSDPDDILESLGGRQLTDEELAAEAANDGS